MKGNQVNAQTLEGKGHISFSIQDAWSFTNVSRVMRSHLLTVSMHTEAELLPVATCVEAYIKCLQHAGICISYMCMSALLLCAHSVVLRNLLGDD